MSMADWLGWPETVQATLLLLTIAFVVAPIVSGLKFGGIEIPRFDPRRRRLLRIAGPVAFLAAVLLVIPVRALRPPLVELRILSADVLENGDIDVAVANFGTSFALLTAIELEVQRESAVISRPVLQSSATYRIPIGDLSVGDRRKIVVRHLLPASAIERFAIHYATSRVASVRVSLYAADGTVLSTVVDVDRETSR